MQTSHTCTAILDKDLWRRTARHAPLYPERGIVCLPHILIAGSCKRTHTVAKAGSGWAREPLFLVHVGGRHAKEVCV